MLAFWITDLLDYQLWLRSPFAWLALAFQLWMLIDAIRRQEWLWVLFIIVFPLLNAVLYFLMVYRAAPALGTGSLELPGAGDRRRIKELESLIHHLDKAHHHAQLGDIYFRQEKFDRAESCFRDALEREPDDDDARSHLGQTLLRLGKPQEALILLQQVCQRNPKHDYGYSMMALAEAYSSLGDRTKAMETWQLVNENCSYARARVALAECYISAGQPDLARGKLQEAVADDVHAPAFERRHERIWIRRARKLLASLSRQDNARPRRSG
jgi:tetratricopeptide (TPR) repeat protein